MAVSKEELFARYKQLKSEGVSITLMELKKQMEAEVKVSTSIEENISAVQTQETDLRGLSQIEKPINSDTQNPSVEQTSNISSHNYGTTASNSWETTYCSQPQVTQPVTTSPASVWKSQTGAAQPQVQAFPNYDVNSELQNNYINSFKSDFTVDHSQKTAGSQCEKSQYVTQQVNSQNFDIQNSEINSERTKYCLIGYPLGHSLSTYIHEAGFKSLNLHYTYEILETPPEKLVDRIKYLKYNGFAGFNVTIPLKLPVTVFLDEIDISADLVGAVNTVVINSDRTMKGYNTDVSGFRNAIPQDITLAGKTIGILGSGGAARAAITAFALEQVKHIKIYTRNVPNSIELLTYLRNRFPNIEFNAYQIEYIRDLSDIDILVNTTPIGMQGRAADLTPVEEPEIKTLPQGAIVYDVIYNPKKTVLIKLAQKNGYRTINGVDMFIHQAVAAEKIWTGQTPDFKDMKIAALENL